MKLFIDQVEYSPVITKHLSFFVQFAFEIEYPIFPVDTTDLVGFFISWTHVRNERGFGGNSVKFFQTDKIGLDVRMQPILTIRFGSKNVK